MRSRYPFGIIRDTSGLALVTSLLVMCVLMALGFIATSTTTLDVQSSGYHRSATVAHYLAEAGAERGREMLRVINSTSINPMTFDDELGNRTGQNNLLDGYTLTTDDTALIPTTSLGDGAYTVYLVNDLIDGANRLADSNGQVTLISVGTLPGGIWDMVDVTVALRCGQLPPPPAAITLLGSGASFAAGNSNAKELHGDDRCGTESPKPVVMVSDSADVGDVQRRVNGSKPGTYQTLDEFNNRVTGLDNIDAIATSLSADVLNGNNLFGINLLDPVALNQLVTNLQRVADTVSADGTDVEDDDLGDSRNPQLVVVTSDFTLSDDGAGILVVTGDLTFNGNVHYKGFILAIGHGYMKRHGGGNGVISGGILVANTRGPDNIAGTADDTVALGPPTFDTSGGGNSSVEYCSEAMNKGLCGLPLRVTASR